MKHILAIALSFLVIPKVFAVDYSLPAITPALE